MRLKSLSSVPDAEKGVVLKRKVSQVWDWNSNKVVEWFITSLPWKEKYLKYEIEMLKNRRHEVLI